VGTESKLRESLALGAHGGVSGGSNVAPEIFTDLYQAVQASDDQAASLANRAVQNWKASTAAVATSPNASIKIFKAALAAMGILGTANVAAPFEALTSAEVARVTEALGTGLRRTSSIAKGAPRH